MGANVSLNASTINVGYYIAPHKYKNILFKGKIILLSVKYSITSN